MALDTLRRAYEDRALAIREQRERGGGVVGIVGNVAPAEFVLAAGLLPVAIAAEPPHPTPLADPWMEPEYGWELRSLLERALRGDFEALDLLVITRPYAHLYYYLKEIVRQGEGPRVPPLYVYDLMQSQRPAVRAYGLNRTDDFLARLERLRGAPISEEALRDAIRLTNRRRAAQQRLQAAREQGRFSGATAVRLLGAGLLMEPNAYADTLTRYVDEGAAEMGLAGWPRLLVVSSEPLYHPMLHETLEAAGGLVVAEDDGWGSHGIGDPVPEDAPSPKLAIFEQYYAGTPSAEVSPRGPRESWLHRQLDRGSVDAVVFYLPPSDQQLGWYYPRLKYHLDERAIPSLLLRQDVLTDKGRASIQAAASDFIAGLRAGDSPS